MTGVLARDVGPDFPPSAVGTFGAAALCVVYGVLFALGMPGYDVPGLPFVCLVPLLVLATSAADGRRAAWRGLAAGTLANLLLVYWIAYTVAVEGKLGWAIGGLAAFLVAAYMGVYVSVGAWAAYRLRKRFGIAGLWAFPAAWVGVEYARAVLFTGFPWMLLGYSLSDRPFLRQAADLAGVYGLGFALAGANVCLYMAGANARKRAWRPAVLNLAGAAAIGLFLFAYGASGTMSGWVQNVGRPIRVGIAQGGIDETVKWDPAYQEDTIRIYRSLTREAKARGAEVVVWPETAAPFFYGWEPELSAEVDNVAAENHVPLIFGAPWFDPSEGGKYYNSVFFLGDRGVPRGRYDKRKLVPFGEYVPLRHVLFFLRKMTEGEEDFSEGKGPVLFVVDGRPVAASVCYEAVFPGIERDSVRAGATWLVNVTNDAWFGNTVAPRQHLAMARMRSVEFRRALVRAANSGISAVVDGRGTTVAEIGLFRTGTIVASIQPRSGETIYAKTGDDFAIGCIIIIVLFLFVPGRRAHGRRNPGGKSRPA